MVDGRRTQDEARDVCRDLLPAVVLHDPSVTVQALRLRVLRCPLCRQEKVRVGNARRPDLKRLAHELVLRVDLAIVPPGRRLGPARGDRRVVTDLLRNIAVLFVVPDVLERLALRSGAPGEVDQRQRQRARVRRRLTSMGLNGLAMRPIVDE